mgnify:CR=1 FL=1
MGKNKMLATTIKKASKQSCMKEFFEGNVPKELNGIRANIILPAVTMLFDYTKRQKDKKAEGGKIHFVLPKAVGDVEIVDLTVEEVIRFLK